MDGHAARLDGLLIPTTTKVVQFDLPADGTPVRAFVTVESQNIRYRYVTPAQNPGTSAGSGHLAPVGQSFIIEGAENVRNWRARGQSTSESYVYYTIEVL